MIPEDIFIVVRAAIDRIPDCERKKGMIDTFVLFESGWKKTPQPNLYHEIRELKKEISGLHGLEDEIQRKNRHIQSLENRIVNLKKRLNITT